MSSTPLPLEQTPIGLAESAPARRRAIPSWLVVVIVGFGSLLSAVSFSSIQIALPKIAAEFAVDVSAASWIPLIQNVIMTGFLLPFGWLGDRIGHRRIFSIGLVVVGLGAAASAMSANLPWLYVGRVIAMLGTAMWIAVSTAIVAAIVTPARRGQALGWQVSFTYVGLASGPTIGGLAMGIWDWRGALWLLVPPTLLMAAAATFLLPPDKPQGAASTRFDVLGAVLLLFGFTATLLTLTRGNDWGWLAPSTIAMGVAGLALLVAFVFQELRVAQPLLDLSLFRNRMFSAATASAILLYVGSWAPTFLAPFYLIDVRHLPPANAGAILAALPIATMIVSPISGVLSDRFGSRLLTAGGVALLVLALVAMGGMPVDAPIVTVALLLGLTGIANGLIMTPNNNALMSSVPVAKRGTAAALMGTARNVGMGIGVAVAGSVYSAVVAASSAPADPVSQMAGIRSAYWVVAALAGLGIFTGLMRGRADQQSAQ